MPPQSETNEWVTDPFNTTLGTQPIGPGFRLPFYVISPWTRNGGVFSEVASHESQTLFLEQWAKAKGTPFTMAEIGQWRRDTLSDLTRMFDFSNKDASAITFKNTVRAPSIADGKYNGAAACKAKYGGGQPPVPFADNPVAFPMEKGWKAARGNPS